jgi:hypothetical protein
MMKRGMRGTIGLLAMLGFLALPSAASAAILWDQNNGGDGTGFFSQTDSNPADADLSRAADDFFVPVGTTFDIKDITVTGHYEAGGPATSVNIDIYLDGGTVPDVAAIHSQDNVVPVQGLATGDFVIPVSLAAPLTTGNYWVSVQANGLDYNSGIWDWDNRPLQGATDPSAAQTNINVPMAICGGMSPTMWVMKSSAGCAGAGAPQDLMFSLADVTPTAPPPPGGGGGTVTPTPTPTAAPPKKCKKGQKLKKGKCVKKKRKKKKKK